jgi:hypothetical protein
MLVLPCSAHHPPYRLYRATRMAHSHTAINRRNGVVHPAYTPSPSTKATCVWEKEDGHAIEDATEDAVVVAESTSHAVIVTESRPDGTGDDSDFGSGRTELKGAKGFGRHYHHPAHYDVSTKHSHMNARKFRNVLQASHNAYKEREER